MIFTLQCNWNLVLPVPISCFSGLERLLVRISLKSIADTFRPNSDRVMGWELVGNVECWYLKSLASTTIVVIQ